MRRSTPGPRAVVGGLLVTLAAVGVFVAYAAADGAPARSYVVVAQDVAVGDLLVPEALRLVEMDLPPEVDTAAFHDVEGLRGAVLLAPLEAGELVQRSAVVVEDGSGSTDGPRHEFSFALDRDRAVNGGLRRGEVVDVLATYGSGESAQTVVAARAAVVRAVDEGQGAGLTSTGLVILTLALGAPEDVLALAHASEIAAVTVVRTTGTTDQMLPDAYPPNPETGRPNPETGRPNPATGP